MNVTNRQFFCYSLCCFFIILDSAVQMPQSKVSADVSFQLPNLGLSPDNIIMLSPCSWSALTASGVDSLIGSLTAIKPDALLSIATKMVVLASF
jgi:hypothetical protein